MQIDFGDSEISGYILLDNGSDTALIRLDYLKSLGLQKEQVLAVIQTVDDNRTAKVINVLFEMHSLDQTEHVNIEVVFIVESMPGHRLVKSVMTIYVSVHI